MPESVTARLDELERRLGSLGTADLPMAAIKRKLEVDWQRPEDLFVAAASCTVLTASSSTVQGPGAVSADVVYASLTLALDAGLWLVWGQATMSSQTAPDGKTLGLWDSVTAAEIAGARGPVSADPTLGVEEAFQTFAALELTGSTSVQLYGLRNGASQITFGYSAGLTAGQRLTAVKLA